MERLKEFVFRVADRIANEPALVVAIVLSTANLIGKDASQYSTIIESAAVLIGGAIVRSRVTPVRNLGE